MKTSEAISKVRDAIRLRHFSLSTEQSYCSWVSRHAYATHCLNGGQNPRAIQQAMGHKCLETTMGYLHAEALSVRSPLELQPSAFSLQPFPP
jgi:site-specific recombinase XerD